MDIPQLPVESTEKPPSILTPSTTHKTCLFLIDVTGSMGSWITALTSVLPSLIRSIALTRVFNSLSIMSYGDYDYGSRDLVAVSSGFCSCENPEEIKKLQTFASNLKAKGGGGTPEAWKTAILELAKTPCEGKLFILHLADAPPHVDGSLDSEGKKEKEALGDKFDYFEILKEFLPVFPQLRYTSLTSNPHPFYCHLAQLTGGHVHRLEGGVSDSNIRTQIGRVLNGWFGFDDPCGGCITVASSNMTQDEVALSKLHEEASVLPVMADKLLSSALFTTIHKMKTDNNFLEYIISEFTSIISESPLSLTISPILGKMWREFCKRRSDVRRDELINHLQKSKKNLSTTDQNVLEEWLKESYNAKAEIDAEVKSFIGKVETVGLLRFIPEDESLCAQKVVQLLAAGDRKSTSFLRAILGRLYIDETYKFPVTIVDEDGEVPLPARSIPWNMKDTQFFELVMHAVAPGSKLTRRYAAMLALHSIQCGSVLSPRAHKFLERVKGTWVNWKRRDDGSVEITDCWSQSFLDLILHPTCQFSLTPEELKQALYFRKVCYALRFFRQLEVTVSVVEPESIDGIYDEHMMKCAECNYDRPLSLIARSGNCGYCKHGSRGNVNYVSVRCYPCGAIYSRDRSAYVLGYSKCYLCRELSGPSPSVRCKTCNHNFVQFFGNELPGGVCKPCSKGEKPRGLKYKECPTLVHQVFPQSFGDLCQSIGFKLKEPIKSNPALYDAVLLMEECEPVLCPPPTGIRYRDQLVYNVEEKWEYMIGVMKGNEPILPECSICLGQFPPSNLTLACGRKGCVQRCCFDCSKAWYSKNTPGTLIYQRATMCQFCSRVPAPNCLSRVNFNLVALASVVAKKSLSPDIYYGWCSSCLKPHEVGSRDCGQEEPVLLNFRCPSCVSGKSISVDAKECPGCTVMTSKVSGCNHINCTCGAHWCWQCREKCADSSSTYEHMWKVHGKIFDEDERYVEADEDEAD